MTAEVPARAVPGTRGPDAMSRRDGGRSSLVWDVLARVIAERAAATGRTALDIVDVGAGTGGFAVSLAGRGHRVTVVDPSPDALAAARWRAAEAGVTLTEVQGEATDLPALLGQPAAGDRTDLVHGADLVICHSVLEYVDSPSAALAAVARVLRPGGTVSVVAANSVAAVLQRALAGKYAEARALLPGGPAAGEAPGSAPSVSPAARRFTLPELTALIEGPACGQATRTASGCSPACCRGPPPTRPPPRRCGSLKRPPPVARRCATSPPGCTSSATVSRPERPADRP